MSISLQQVPELDNKLCGPLLQLEKHLLERQAQTESWLRQQWRLTPAPIYASVDLRNAGFKLAPVDTNLFPAGFNNLNPAFLPLCIQAAQTVFEQIKPGCLRILLVPENHTRNPFYFESVALIQEILLKAGFEVRIGSLLDDLSEAKQLTLPSGRSIELLPIRRVDNRLVVDNFNPCLIVLNNDLSSGVPPVLQALEQPIFPALKLGWSTRTKSSHFQYYQQVANEFCEVLDLDPWLINPYFRSCSSVDFLKREGEEELMAKTAELLQEIQQKYDIYEVKQKPYVVIKAESGTYGMGVLIVHSAEEIATLNRKKRSGMAVIKGGREIHDVILQEGVYTFETWQQAVAEPVVYLLGQNVVGGFYRVHTGRGITDNLNAPGMQFIPHPFVDACNNPERNAFPDAAANRFYAYGVIARLATVAAAREQAALR